MPLTPEEKAMNQRARMLEKSREYQIGTYTTQVARVFQRMMRAEWAAKDESYEIAVAPVSLGLDLIEVRRQIGQLVCVTCGRIGPWSGQVFDCGHFLAGRNNSIVFEETNVAPQCKHCNRMGGAPVRFKKWMTEVRGQDEIDRLLGLKHKVVRKFTREELVDMRIGYLARTKLAEARL